MEKSFLKALAKSWSKVVLIRPKLVSRLSHNGVNYIQSG